MNAKLKSFFAVGIDEQLPLYVPPNPGHFAIVVRAMVGPDDGPGEESFDVVACTPSWLAQVCEERGFISGRHHVIFGRYDWPLIDATLRKLINNLSGDSWAEVAVKVAQIGHWEFDDYYTARNSTVNERR